MSVDVLESPPERTRRVWATDVTPTPDPKPGDVWQHEETGQRRTLHEIRNENGVNERIVYRRWHPYLGLMDWSCSRRMWDRWAANARRVLQAK